MPTSLFADMERGSGGGGGGVGGGIEDQRALQLALELSMLGLNDDDSGGGGGGGGGGGLGPNGYENDSRGKKSQNMTECVPVPSSEHVAEIVGRQGCKIKALRAKTNTYIKTPVRGEEPVFVVTGRKEDVNMAKREILSAAEHFSQIRASRKNNMNGALAPGPPANVPGQTTIQVRVPYRVVGLVVGPKGATIKRIQQQTNTYIVTPSRDKEPVFEVTGLPENVESARKEIEAHIAMRTGGILDPGDPGVVDFRGGTTNCMDHQAFTGAMNVTNDFVSSLYKSTTSSLNGLNLLNSSAFFCDSNNILGHHHHHHHPQQQHSSRSQEANIFSFAPPLPASAVPPGSSPPKLNDFVSPSPAAFSANGFGLYDTDEGIAESPTFDPTVAPPGSASSALWPDLGGGGGGSSNGHNGVPNGSANNRSVLYGAQRSSSVSGPSSSARLSPPLGPDSVAAAMLDHPPARRIRSDPLSGAALGAFAPAGVLSGFATTSSSGGSASSSPTESLGSGRKTKRDCFICFESEVVAALVPCGHNLFCLECANRLCDKAEPECPVCHQPVTQAIRIYS